MNKSEVGDQTLPADAPYGSKKVAKNLSKANSKEDTKSLKTKLHHISKALKLICSSGIAATCTHVRSNLKGNAKIDTNHIYRSKVIIINTIK